MFISVLSSWVIINPIGSLINFFCFIYNQEIITFESANPFSFKDIITNLDNQDKQKVFGVLTLPENTNPNKKYPQSPDINSLIQ